ncbi:type II CAAX endopeptidase family protein [Virgibacillus sp. YIM 98842]|uniref:CPBP family intramembrane glutamic endopeptidase n=1 Tax=Virgibacillus sp. YIM 98842 TaxID=2663533 RepID=UPI0013DA511D|nr:type II CAAX endopeptidase family protein [Virgibacillus sp. YIM 98842]
MPKRYWWVIITYFIMQYSALLIVPFTDLIPLNEADILVYWTIFSFSLALVIVLLLMRPDMKMGSARDASSAGQIILWSFLGLFMAYFGQGLAAMIEMELLGIDPGSENTQAIMDIARYSPIFMIVPAIIGPILEELIFRKIIFGEFYKRMNFIFSALLSSFIFAIVHNDPQHLLIYTTMGFVFAFLYVKTKRIMVPIIVHAAMNSLVVLVQYNIDPEEIERMLEELQFIFIGG